MAVKIDTRKTVRPHLVLARGREAIPLINGEFQPGDNTIATTSFSS
jgi:hypothetical protein